MKQITTVAKIFDKNMRVIETIPVNLRRSRQEQSEDIRKKYKKLAFAFQIIRPEGPALASRFRTVPSCSTGLTTDIEASRRFLDARKWRPKGGNMVSAHLWCMGRPIEY